jgi:L-asparaginase II
MEWDDRKGSAEVSSGVRKLYNKGSAAEVSSRRWSARIVTPESFNPVIEILRGGQVESIHGAAAVVVDGQGKIVARLGDPNLPVYWRSAAKPFQAWPLVQSGAADRFSLSEAELALACASHGGEDRHVEVAEAMLARGGYTSDDLQCGPQLPMTETAAQALLRSGSSPTSLHNNCSGKHAGMLLLGQHLQADPGGYLQPGEPVQMAIRAAMARITGADEAAITTAVDGCSAPTFRLSLEALALAYMRLAASLTNGNGDPGLARLARAMTSHPGLVAGEGRLDTALMEAAPGAIIAKLGAEGIYAVGLAAGRTPLGLAVKIADGDADRARTALTLSLLDWLGAFSQTARVALKAQFPGEIYNRRGVQVGAVRVRLADYLVSHEK